MVQIFEIKKSEGMYKMGYFFLSFNSNKFHYVYEERDSMVDLKNQFLTDVSYVIASNTSALYSDCIATYKEEEPDLVYSELLKRLRDCCQWLTDNKSKISCKRICETFIKAYSAFISRCCKTEKQKAYGGILVGLCNKAIMTDEYVNEHFK